MKTWGLLLVILLVLGRLAYAASPTTSRTTGLDLMSSSGTITAYTLLKQSGGVAVEATTSDTTGILGIATQVDSTNARVAYTARGPWYCTFDSGTVTADDVFGASTTTASDCVDLGSLTTACASNVQVLGQITSNTVPLWIADSNSGAVGTNTFPVNMDRTLCGRTINQVAKADATAQSANIAATTVYAVPANSAGAYRISCYTVVTQAATTSSTLPACGLNWTDSDTGVALGGVVMTATKTSNTVGTNGLGTGGGSLGVMTIFAAASSNIQYTTTSYASAGATPMLYAVHVRVERLGS